MSNGYRMLMSSTPPVRPGTPIHSALLRAVAFLDQIIEDLDEHITPARVRGDWEVWATATAHHQFYTTARLAVRIRLGWAPPFRAETSARSFFRDLALDSDLEESKALDLKYARLYLAKKEEA